MPSGREQFERQAEERRRVRRAQREAARRSRTRRQALIAGSVVIVLVIVGVIVLSVVNGSGKKGVRVAAGGCTYVADAASTTATSPGFPPDQRAVGSHTLTIKLTQGTVAIKLDAAAAPCTVNSFQFLASKGFFTGTACHRLTTSGIFVLQCGDPTGTGSGGPGYTIPDENLTGATYPAGTVAMANTGKVNSGGSQFFLVYKDSTLGPSYTPFGTITSGLPVLTKIAAAGVTGGGTDGKPLQTPKILSFTIS